MLGTTSLPAVATPRHSRSWARGRFVDHRTWCQPRRWRRCTWRGRHSSMTASPSPRSSTGRRLACSDDRCGTLWVPRRPGAGGLRTGRQPLEDRPWRHRGGHGAGQACLPRVRGPRTETSFLAQCGGSTRASVAASAAHHQLRTPVRNDLPRTGS